MIKEGPEKIAQLILCRVKATRNFITIERGKSCPANGLWEGKIDLEHAIAGLVSYDNKNRADAALSHILLSLEVCYLYAENNFLFR